MAHAEERVIVNRPVNQVFAFILDGTNNPLWRSSVLDIERVPGTPAEVGARFKQGLKGPGGRRIAGDYEITECQPNTLIRFQVIAGPARPTGAYSFEPVNEGTAVTFSLDHEPRGLIERLMSPMIARTMRQEVTTLGQLKTYLEQGGKDDS
jgi:uncharacterized membrane protein